MLIMPAPPKGKFGDGMSPVTYEELCRVLEYWNAELPPKVKELWTSDNLVAVRFGSAIFYVGLDLEADAMHLDRSDVVWAGKQLDGFYLPPIHKRDLDPITEEELDEVLHFWDKCPPDYKENRLEDDGFYIRMEDTLYYVQVDLPANPKRPTKAEVVAAGKQYVAAEIKSLQLLQF